MIVPSWNWAEYHYRVAPPALTERWGIEDAEGKFQFTSPDEKQAREHMPFGGRIFLMREIR